jgi:WhiB family redox-sensing transcriptional regulator
MSADDWKLSAACRGMDTRIFFPGLGSTGAEAKAVCAACPVAEPCREGAIERREEFGIWGGITESTRKNILKARRRERLTAVAS